MYHIRHVHICSPYTVHNTINCICITTLHLAARLSAGMGLDRRNDDRCGQQPERPMRAIQIPSAFTLPSCFPPLEVSRSFSGLLLASRSLFIPESPLILDASRQFQSMRLQNAKHTHFEVDPELRLNPGDGVQEVGSSATYYVSWHVPSLRYSLSSVTFLTRLQSSSWTINRSTINCATNPRC